MTVQSFYEKLRKLNKDIVLIPNLNDKSKPQSLSLKRRPQVEDLSSTDLQYAGSARNYLTQTEYEHICGVPGGDSVPELDVIDVEKGKLIERGWRSTLLYLIKQRIVDRDKARRVFKCGSLGETPYDLAKFAQKLEWAREDGGWSDPDSRYRKFKEAVKSGETFSRNSLKEFV